MPKQNASVLQNGPFAPALGAAENLVSLENDITRVGSKKTQERFVGIGIDR